MEGSEAFKKRFNGHFTVDSKMVPKILSVIDEDSEYSQKQMLQHPCETNNPF